MSSGPSASRFRPAAASLTLAEVGCCLCGASEAETESAGYDFEYATAGNEFRFARCRRCDHVYLSPRPGAADLGVIYPPTYYTLATPGRLVRRMQRLWERRKVDAWRRATGPGKKRVLDVGCGGGRILEVLRACGPADWELVGVDFDPAAVEQCRRKGFQAVAARVEDWVEADGSFDAVTMLQLIEHVEDPVLLSRRVHALLRPGGVFVVETPDIAPAGIDYRIFRGRHWGHYHFPRHWNLFTTTSLERMLRGAGFEIVVSEQLISPATWIVSLHNRMLDRGWPEPLVRFFSYRNPLLLALFVAVDVLRVRLGLETSNQRVIARKPA